MFHYSILRGINYLNQIKFYYEESHSLYNNLFDTVLSSKKEKKKKGWPSKVRPKLKI